MMRNKLIPLLLALAVFIALNYFGKYVFFRMDLTENKAFTLSNATKDLLSNMDEELEVTAYFSDDLPVDIAKTREELDHLLNEYSNLSKGKLDYSFIAPNADAKAEEEANAAGIRPVMINVREKDQAKQQKAFLGAVIKAGEKKEVIPIIQPGIAMEYAFTTSIKKLIAKQKAKIGFVQGHGEAPLQELQQAYQELSILYELSSVYLSNDTIDLASYKTLVMVRPTDSIPPTEFSKLDNYLSNGGNLVLAYNQIDANLQYGFANATNASIKDYLSTKGLLVEDGLIRDTKCGQVSVTQQQGFFSFSSPVQFPYLPLVQKFSDHPITKGLEQVIFEFASPMLFSNHPEYQFTAIISSSEKSGTGKAPIQFDVQHQWQESEFDQQFLNIGGLLESKSSSSKIVVFTDGDFMINGREQRRQNEDNISLFVNSIDFLSDDTGLIDLRTKSVETRPIEELSDTKRNNLKYLNLLLPVALVLVYGVYRSSRNRNIRKKRMEEKF